jgi:hypothetical protein
MIVYPEPVVLMELYERDQRTQQFVASLQSFPPDDNTTDIMTDGGDETQRLIPDAAEANALGPSNDVGQ